MSDTTTSYNNLSPLTISAGCGSG